MEKETKDAGLSNGEKKQLILAAFGLAAALTVNHIYQSFNSSTKPAHDVTSPATWERLQRPEALQQGRTIIIVPSSIFNENKPKALPPSAPILVPPLPRILTQPPAPMKT